MPSEGTNAHMSALHLWVQADGSPEHTSVCSPWVGGEEKQQKRVRAMLGTAGGTRKGEGGFWQVIVLEKCWCSGQTGQKGKDHSEFGGCSLEQMEVRGLGGSGCVPLGQTSPAPLHGLHHPGQAEVPPVWAMISGIHGK